MTGDWLSDGVLRAGGFTERIKRPHPENEMKEKSGEVKRHLQHMAFIRCTAV